MSVLGYATGGWYDHARGRGAGIALLSVVALAGLAETCSTSTPGTSIQATAPHTQHTQHAQPTDAPTSRRRSAPSLGGRDTLNHRPGRANSRDGRQAALALKWLDVMVRNPTSSVPFPCRAHVCP